MYARGLVQFATDLATTTGIHVVGIVFSGLPVTGARVFVESQSWSVFDGTFVRLSSTVIVGVVVRW